jgi:hypothetical protein
MALEVIGTAKESSSWLGSLLDAYRGQSSEPIHIAGKQQANAIGHIVKRSSLTLVVAMFSLRINSTDLLRQRAAEMAAFTTCQAV